MQHDHPDVVALRELGDEVHGPLNARKAAQPAGAELAPDPEAHGVAREGADPAHGDQRSEIERAGARRVAGEQAEQERMPGGVAEHEAVGDIAVLADELEEGGKVGGKGQGRGPFEPGRLRGRNRQRALASTANGCSQAGGCDAQRKKSQVCLIGYRSIRWSERNGG